MATPRRLLRKVLRYRDQGGATPRQHAEHWAGFRWTAGPVIVASVGPWGTVQVWAVSAAAIAGLDPDGNAEAEWIVTQCSDPRYGRVAEMMVLPTLEGIGVSKRPGPSGPPELHQLEP